MAVATTIVGVLQSKIHLIIYERWATSQWRARHHGHRKKNNEQNGDEIKTNQIVCALTGEVISKKERKEET
eukprot:CAMPEP_0206473484 /NCGR_PEP_ID=MMETSP0324_2-20121206/32889_1 /ASSEMBLY_ACC=CAM_ASM_000836 /TAXON_ID=2866 /ORGANISM="Crypthecodinium cohnii, Strain Seligo" /LENGTH=70 /DNA_ID=CAMNT_0053948415 /DNA_START=60 /DNA_END=269 /DNA_ORIENTATION=-